MKTEWKPKSPCDTRCKCGGTLWNITSLLAEALGIITLRCDKCGKTYGVDTGEKK